MFNFNLQFTKKLNKEKIKFFHVYPSAILILASYMERYDDYLTYTPETIFATSENLYPGQKEKIEKIFACRMISHYGHSEMSGIALGCPYYDHYHIEDLYGYLELVDSYGKVITQPNIRGEIVVTGFNNYAFPFIRYRTGDYAFYGDNNCKYTNRRILKSIEGRWKQEMLIAPKGNHISMTALNMHTEIFDHVKNYQFYQEKIGICELRIIKDEKYSIDDEKAIYDAIKNKLGKDFVINIVYVDKIEKAKSGKFRYIISQLT